MPRKRFASIAHAIAPFLLLGTLFLGGLYYVLLSNMTRIVRQDAAIATAGLADYLSANPGEIDRLRRGEGLSPAASQFFSSYAASQKIAGFRLLNGERAPVSALVRPGSSNRGGAAANPVVVESALPLAKSGQSPLLLEAFSDQSVREQAFKDELLRAFLALVFLTACSFGVPAVVVLREVAQRQRGEERADYLARHDILTTLMNRTAFNAALEAELAKSDARVALFFIDLDRFKSINDSLGHDIGDELIKSVAARLSATSSSRDFVARFGGDEFVMARVGIASTQEAEARAANLKWALAQPMTLGEHQIAVTASIGVAVSPRDGASLTTLTRAADLALYSAKADGRDSWRTYHPRMDAALQQRQRLEKALLAAMADDGFELYFQPIVRSKSKKLIGFEVLLRLNDGGVILPPADFIPLAEEMGLISEIGAGVIKKACTAAVGWPEALTVAVNLSPRQFENGELCAVVEAALRESGLAAERLELEITEGLLLADSDRVLDQLRELKALGVSIAMDDFGTGYSSLSYLWRFPFDKLKIDRSFMRVLTNGDPSVSSILNTIVSLGRTLNLHVTAEGVETEEQARLLRDLDCDQLQGYHFGRPMPEAALAKTIFDNLKRTDLESEDEPGASKADAA